MSNGAKDVWDGNAGYDAGGRFLHSKKRICVPSGQDLAVMNCAVAG
jgi:hypothetical protein